MVLLLYLEYHFHASGFTQDTMNDAVILGVTYPVYVEDLGVLAGLKRIKDEDTENLLVMTGKTSSEEREYTGADILFAGGDYAYYILSGEPTNYKTLTVDGNKFSFSAVKNGAVDGGELTGEPTYNGHHTQVTYAVGNEALAGVTVNGVIVTTSDGSKYALRHVWDIWRITELGWNWNDIDGTGLACKNITNVTYYVKADADYKVFSYDVNVTMKLQPAAITAELEEGIKTVKVSGIPADAENAKATVKSKVGRGETPVVLADGAVINDGVIELTDMADHKTTYTVTVLSDNYADMSAAFECASKEKLAVAIEAAKKLAADENLDGETKAARSGTQKRILQQQVRKRMQLTKKSRQR